jgi:hypothetical protein
MRYERRGWKVSSGLGALLLVPLWLLAPGCQGKEPALDAGTEVGSDVRVLGFDRHYTASGVQDVAWDLAANPPELLVLGGESFSSVPGAPTDAGVYTFPDVPPGTTYYLKHKGTGIAASDTRTTYTITDARKVELSNGWLGRADAQRLSQTTLSVEANLTGLEPWPQDDSSWLMLASEDVELSGYLGVPGTLAPGTTEVHGPMNYFRRSRGLSRFEQARGDRAWVTQSVLRRARNAVDGRTLDYNAMVRGLHLPPFSFDGTGPLVVSGTMEARPLKQVSLDWRVSAFTAHAAEIHPSATPYSSYMVVYPSVHGVATGVLGYQMGSLLQFETPAGYTQDVQAQLGYGNPFPTTWGEVAYVAQWFGVEYSFPGATFPLRLLGTLDFFDEVSALSAALTVPRLLPARGLTVDGVEVSVARELALGGHVIAWQPPASGSVDVYSLRVMRYEVVNGWPTLIHEDRFELDGDATSVRLPPDILKPSSHYVLELLARSAPHSKVEEQSSLTPPLAQASLLSGLLSTP